MVGNDVNGMWDLLENNYVVEIAVGQAKFECKVLSNPVTYLYQDQIGEGIEHYSPADTYLYLALSRALSYETGPHR